MTEKSPFGPASLDVQPQALVDFSTTVKELASTATETMNPSMSDIGAAEFGGAPVDSAAPFLRSFARGNLELSAFLQDLGQASSAFMMGSLTIAANYIISDDAAKDEMADVDVAFSTAGVPAEQTLSGAQAAHDAEVQQRIDGIEPEQLPESEQVPPAQQGAPHPETPQDRAFAESLAISNPGEDPSFHTGDSTDMSDVRASIDAPLSVQQEMAGTTQDDAYIGVVDHDGSIKYIPNPDYVPTYDYHPVVP